MIECFKVVVDCQYNDEVDIKCGGPEYLGYDFYVDPEIVTEMMEYIQETCKELNVPIINLYFDCSKFYNKKDFWTKEKIYECIENNEAGLNFNAISCKRVNMDENYLKKARVRSVLYKSEKDKQRLEKVVSYRVKKDLELLENVKKDLSIIYTLDEYKICKHISRLRNLIYKSNLSNDEKFEMLKFVNSAIPKVALKRIEERRERARKNGYNF